MKYGLIKWGGEGRTTLVQLECRYGDKWFVRRVDTSGRPTWKHCKRVALSDILDTWDYLPSRRQRAFARQCAGEDDMQAQHLTDGWTIIDGAGGRWWPDGEAAAEIDAAADPEATALRICREYPMRGEWRE